MNILTHYTLRNLRLNRMRTLVTIIGIILSACMFTAVTTCISSLKHFMIETIYEDTGAWEYMIEGLPKEEALQFGSLDSVKDAAYLQNLGASRIENPRYSNKSFLYVTAASENYTDMIRIHITEGRMPQSGSEILVPEPLHKAYEDTYDIGSTITLELSTTTTDHTVIHPNVWSEDPIELEKGEQRTYTIVGYCEQLPSESFWGNSYILLTLSDGTGADSYTTYVTSSNPRETNSYITEHYYSPSYTISANYSLLRWTDIQNSGSFYSVVFGLAVILIGLIMFGSISLIYNAFSISVSERKKQFGLLKSIGTTKKQIMHSVMCEALLLSCIGIPLGILFGILGMGVTFYLCQDLFAHFMSTSRVALTIYASWPAILIAAVIALITVIISAWLPARKAIRVSAMEAIHQAPDYTIKPIRSSRLTYKLFGFEGMLAARNYKRNRSKYRATVLSLFMSILLFISSTSFCSYLTGGMQDIATESSDYDISYYLSDDDDSQSIYEMLSRTEGITNHTYWSWTSTPCYLDRSQLDDKYWESSGISAAEPNKKVETISLFFIADDDYEQYLKEQGLDPAVYMDTQSPTAVLYDYNRGYDSNTGQYYTYNAFDASVSELDLPLYDWEEESRANDDGLSREPWTTVHIGAHVDTKPFGLSNYSDAISLLYPYSARETLLPDTKLNVSMTFTAENPDEAYETLSDALISQGLPVNSLYNYAEDDNSVRAYMTIIQIFSYGFIILISLIATANVFNTISTNIQLRRREFAMLRSVGLTRRGLYRMLNFESLLYGLRSLMYGIPASILVTYLIYSAISAGINSHFYIPWSSIVIAVGSVFLVIFASMLYAARKIQNDNPMEVLKQD